MVLRISLLVAGGGGNARPRGAQTRSGVYASPVRVETTVKGDRLTLGSSKPRTLLLVNINVFQNQRVVDQEHMQRHIKQSTWIRRKPIL